MNHCLKKSTELYYCPSNWELGIQLNNLQKHILEILFRKEIIQMSEFYRKHPGLRNKRKRAMINYFHHKPYTSDFRNNPKLYSEIKKRFFGDTILNHLINFGFNYKKKVILKTPNEKINMGTIREYIDKVFF